MLCLQILYYNYISVTFLAQLYVNGEQTFEIHTNGKLKTVTVNRREYHLTKEAVIEFERVHDHWELDVCKKKPHDPLVGGIYHNQLLPNYNYNFNYYAFLQFLSDIQI